MSLQVQLALRGRLAEEVRRRGTLFGRAVAAAVNQRARQLQRAMRADVERALGARLARAVRRRGFPARGRGEDAAAHPEAAAIVWSGARLGRGQPDPMRAAPIDLLAVWSQPQTIRARGGTALAIPTAAVPRVGSGAAQRPARPGELGIALEYRPTRTGAGMLVGRDGVVYYVLVRQVRHPARLRLPQIIARYTRDLAPVVEREFARRLGR